jgi:hypothetical protein
MPMRDADPTAGAIVESRGIDEGAHAALAVIVRGLQQRGRFSAFIVE